MDRQENLEYRRSCPYDAMGDFGRLTDGSKPKRTQEGQTVQPEK